MSKTLSELHWLPIVYYVSYKWYIVMHVAVSGESPNYVTGILRFTASIPDHRNVCLADTFVYHVRNFLEKSFVSRIPMSVE